MNIAQRRVQERLQRKHVIVEAALHTFAAKGIKETTIDDIAAHAALGKGTIYYYFPSKEAILTGAIETTVDAHFSGFERAEKLETPYDIAEALLTGCAQDFRKNPTMFKVLYMVLAEPRGAHSDALKGFIRRHMSWLNELKQASVPLLQEHGLDPDAFLSFVGTHVHGLMVLASSGRPLEGLLKDSLHALKAILNEKTPHQKRTKS